MVIIFLLISVFILINHVHVVVNVVLFFSILFSVIPKIIVLIIPFCNYNLSFFCTNKLQLYKKICIFKAQNNHKQLSTFFLFNPLTVLLVFNFFLMLSVLASTLTEIYHTWCLVLVFILLPLIFNQASPCCFNLKHHITQHWKCILTTDCTRAIH